MKIPHSRLTAWLVKLNHMTQAEADEYAKLADVPVGHESALTQRLVGSHNALGAFFEAPFKRPLIAY